MTPKIVSMPEITGFYRCSKQLAGTNNGEALEVVLKTTS